MLTISKPLISGQAKDYFLEEYSNAENNYYSENETIKGEWFGNLAEEWGLIGEVTKEQYDRLVEGQDPLTGKQLIRKVTPHTQKNLFGEEVKVKGHRAAYDGTWSIMKTGSLAALVGGDERIRSAHRKAVRAGMVKLEEYAQAKMGNTRPSVTTGRIIAAMFEHDTARPDKEQNYAAPQLHTHAIIFNLTQTLDGKWRALDSKELFGLQSYFTAIYRSVLAIELQRLGYEIEVDGKTGAPEIVGFSKEYVEASSPRSRELRKAAKEMKARLEAEGKIVRDGAGLRQAAATASKQSKKFDRAEMRERHQEMDKKYGDQGHRAVAAALGRGPIEHSREEVANRVKEAVTFGISRAMDPQAVVKRPNISGHSLRWGMGFVAPEEIEQEIAKRELSGKLIGIRREARMEEATTWRMLDLERKNIREVLSGKDKEEPIVEADDVMHVIDEIAARKGINLNRSQREAVAQLLTNRDRIFGLQGRAGTGKTTVLSVLKEAAEEAGYTVIGVAPSTPAVKALSDSGIETMTLQKFTFSKPQANAEEGRRLFVLDESSLASTDLMHKFFDRLRPEDRIWTVGDIGQHSAVEAGAPFEQFQLHGMGTAKLTEIVRQKNELKQVVEKLAERKIRDAVKDLIAQGRVFEYADDATRLQAMAVDYCAKREGTVVISPGNLERLVFNGIVHGALQRMGIVEKEDHRVSVLINRADMTKTERTFAGAYEPGDIIRYNHSSKSFRVGDYAKVISHDSNNNLIVRLLRDNSEFTYDPRRLSGVSVYIEAERDFAAGDLIQFRAPLAEKRIATGELGTILEITEKMWKVELRDKRVVMIDPAMYRHLDHGYAITSYSSQCATFPRVLFNADTKESALLLNEKTGYVAISRGIEVVVYTDSKEKLADALSRTQGKEMALEALEQHHLRARPTKQRRNRVRHGKGQAVDRPLRAVSEAKEQRGAEVNSQRAQNKFSQLNVERHRSERTNTDLPNRGEMPPTRSASVEGQQPVQQRPRRLRSFTKTVTEYERPTFTPRQRTGFIRTSKKRPCPICERTHYCSIAKDGSFVVCTKEPSEYEAKNGAGWIHPLNDRDKETVVRKTQVTVTQYERTDIKKLDAVNQELLRVLGLNNRDRADLERRGLDRKTMEVKGYRSVPHPQHVGSLMERFKDSDLKGIPGFFTRDEKWRLNIGEWVDRKGVTHSFHKGYLIPVRDDEGRIQGFQIRRAEVHSCWVKNEKTGIKELKEEPRYIWLSSNEKESGTSSGAPVHHLNVDRIRETGMAVITEGALKADVSSSLLGEQYGFLALAGVNSFPDDFGQRLRVQMPDLKQVVIAFDADADKKVEVQQALNRLKDVLSKAGLDVREVKWEESLGKGLDDYLLKDPSHRDKVRNFLQESLASLNRGEVSERSRSQDNSIPHAPKITL
jgi:conjugative relaxase-like TrwC/TraI family protein